MTSGDQGPDLNFLKLPQKACTQSTDLCFIMTKQQPYDAVQVASHLVSERINMFVLQGKVHSAACCLADTASAWTL